MPPDLHAGNQYGLKHGVYVKSALAEDCSLDDVIDDLYKRFRGLGAYLEHELAAGGPLDHAVPGLLDIHRRAAWRLSRLLRSRHVLAEAGDDEIIRMTGAAKWAAQCASRRLWDREALYEVARCRLNAAFGEALDELSEELGADL